MKKAKALLVAAVFILSSSLAAAYAGGLTVADFNSGGKPNNVGGDFGSWDKDPNDTTQKCTNYFDGNNRYGDEGYALAIEYDVDSPNPAYNGFWMKLQDLDTTSYDKLTLWIRGDVMTGFTTQIKLELKSASGEVGKYLLKDIGPSWKEVTVPLSEFRGLKDKTKMTEFVIVFDDANSTTKVGKIYIDDIAFAN